MPAARKSIRLSRPPEGFQYQKDFVRADEEAGLVAHIEKLALKE